MQSRFNRLLLALSLIFAAVSCNGVVASDNISLADLTNKYSLAVNSSWQSGRVQLTGTGIRLTLAPGLSQIVYNGHHYALRSAPQYINGKLVLPSELQKLLPAPAPKKPEPKNAFTVYSDKTVILDPGHGGRDPGAIGAYGVKEKDVNLAVGLVVREVLRSRGVKVIMTRDRDVFPSLSQRAELANRTPNSIFISIHANSSGDASVTGVETFVLSDNISDNYRTRKAASKYRIKHPTTSLTGHGERMVLSKMCREARSDSYGLARNIHKLMVTSSGDDDRGIKSENLHVLRENYFAPAVLLELGFLSNRYSARQLSNAKFQRVMGECIANGISNYLNSEASKLASSAVLANMAPQQVAIRSY